MKMHALIRSALRQVWWRRSPKRQAAVKAWRLNGKRCAICGVKHDKPQIDHITPVGPTPGSRLGQSASWDILIARLFDGELQALCEVCHRVKTLQERRSA